MDVSQLSLDEVAQRCEEETANYWQKLAVDTRYCFELLRRALEDQVQDAFTYVFRIYQPQCARWALGVSGFENTNEPSPDVFVSEAFAKLFRDLRGEKFRQFDALPAVLLYLKKCVVTSILQQLRRRHPDEIESGREADVEEVQAEGAFESAVEYEQTWARVCHVLPNQDDQNLADYRYRQNLKPAEIAHLHPAQWPSAREVSVALQRISRILRKDRELRAMAGLRPNDEYDDEYDVDLL